MIKDRNLLNRQRLKSNLLDAIKQGLERKTMDRCSTWAIKSRVMGKPFPGPWSFKYHPWTVEMHDSDNDFCVGQKAAQLAYTETLLNRTFYKIDICKESVLYILPTKSPDATDFSSSRFDPALELSPYLSNLFSDTKNVGLKRAGSVCLYVRGSRSRGGLKSIPASSLHFDEVDEMTQENIPLAFERQSGQSIKQTWMISTPTVDDYGINQYFKKSKQKEFFFNCPHCSRLIDLTFPESLVITGDDPDSEDLKNTYLICKECKHKLEHTQKHMFLRNGIWVPKEPNNVSDGYHINQLYSSTIEPYRLAQSYLLSLVNPAHEQEFYNSKLGLPHIGKGAKISDEDINQCIGSHTNGTIGSGDIITMGIDVGTYLHYCIVSYKISNDYNDINMASKATLLECNKVLSFEEIPRIIYKHKPITIVIDANPERRKAYELAQKFWGHMWLCFYGNHVNGKQISKTKDKDGQELEQAVTVDRTSWLDLSLTRHTNRTIVLPIDIHNEYKKHIKSLVRKPEIDANGNPTAKYINTDADHYGHALNYAEIALTLASMIGSHSNIRSPV